MERTTIDLTIPVTVYHETGADLGAITDRLESDVAEQVQGSPVVQGEGDLLEARADEAFGDVADDDSLVRATTPEDVAQRIRERVPVRRVPTPHVEEALADPDRVIAEYRKQEMRDGRIAFIGREYWDVTAKIEAKSRSELENLKNADYSTDSLVHPHSDHDGPHDVWVTEQIWMYLKHRES